MAGLATRHHTAMSGDVLSTVHGDIQRLMRRVDELSASLAKERGARIALESEANAQAHDLAALREHGEQARSEGKAALIAAAVSLRTEWKVALEEAVDTAAEKLESTDVRVDELVQHWLQSEREQSDAWGRLEAQISSHRDQLVAVEQAHAHHREEDMATVSRLVREEIAAERRGRQLEEERSQKQLQEEHQQLSQALHQQMQQLAQAPAVASVTAANTATAQTVDRSSSGSPREGGRGTGLRELTVQLVKIGDAVEDRMARTDAALQTAQSTTSEHRQHLDAAMIAVSRETTEWAHACVGHVDRYMTAVHSYPCDYPELIRGSRV